MARTRRSNRAIGVRRERHIRRWRRPDRALEHDLEKPAPDLIRGGNRFPACAKPGPITLQATGRLLEVEFEVHAGAEDIFSQADADGNWWTAGSDQASRCRAVHGAVAKIDKQIFDLGGPIIGEGPFESGAGGPAGLSVAGGDAVEVCLHIGEGAAGGGIEES